MRGCFITIEGIEGVGKSTALTAIENYLKIHQRVVQLTREPGGTLVAEKIRALLLATHEESLTQDTELLLMFASRAQHLAKVILPALNAGTWVVCDRFTDASYAYQGGGRGVPNERIAALEKWVQGRLQPDLTFLLDAPVSLALERIRTRGEPDRIEREDDAFFARIRDMYLARAKQYAYRFCIIDASQSKEAVQHDIEKQLARLLRMKFE